MRLLGLFIIIPWRFSRAACNILVCLEFGRAKERRGAVTPMACCEYGGLWSDNDVCVGLENSSERGSDSGLTMKTLGDGCLGNTSSWGGGRWC